MSPDIANVTGWFVNKINELTNDTNRKATLQEMKSVISNLEKGALLQVSRSASLNVIFDCLNTSDTEEIELASSIIYLLLENMSGNEQLQVYGGLLQRALAHPSSNVKATILKLLVKMINEETLVLLSNEYSLLLVQALECLASPERNVAQGAITSFINMGTSLTGLNILFSKTLIDSFKKIMAVDDTSRFRVYEILVAVSEKSLEGLRGSISSELLPSLLLEIKSTDNLIQLNALELMSTLASCNHGLTYLQESGVIPYLVDKILKLEEEPLSFILLPGLIEFFGNLYKLQPEEFSKQYPGVLNKLFENLETSDPVLLGVIITTVGKISSTSTGKVILSKTPENMKKCLQRCGQLLSSKNEIGVTIINSLSQLLSADNEELTDVTKQWFDELGKTALETIVTIAKLPFVELRLAALVLLNVIAKQSWGTEKLCSYPGVVEYLTDRSTEFNKECKNAKYDIVVSIVNSPILSNVVSSEVIIKLRGFVNEGPFYVETIPEMAIEGAS